MTTITIKIDERFNISKIVASLRKLKGVKQVIINEETSFERIPGLPYTHEERMASLREAIDDFERGVPGIPHEEMVKITNSWF